MNPLDYINRDITKSNIKKRVRSHDEQWNIIDGIRKAFEDMYRHYMADWSDKETLVALKSLKTTSENTLSNTIKNIFLRTELKRLIEDIGEAIETVQENYREKTNED